MSTAIIGSVGADMLSSEIFTLAVEKLREQNVPGDIVFVISAADAEAYGIKGGQYVVSHRYSVPVADDPMAVPRLKHGPERRNDWDKGRRPSWKARRRGRR